MKTLLKQIAATMLLMSVGGLAAAQAGGTNIEMLNLLKAAMGSRVMAQEVAQNYLYAGNDIAVTKAKKKTAVLLKAFDAQQKKLADSINDPKQKNLMLFINMNMDEIKDVIKKPYSLDNAAEVVDLAEAVSEGELKIASVIQKVLKYKGPSVVVERYNIIQIAKYYMAYGAGLKDDVTVRNMKKTVENFQNVLRNMKAFNGNNAKMNQGVNRINKLWEIVRQFYLDIKEGGLPLIVYQTSEKIDKELVSYVKELIKTKAAHKGK